MLAPDSIEYPRDPAPAVTRALRILDLLADAGPSPLTLSDIARALGVAKSSTSNICTVLENWGMIRRVSGGYRLDRKTAELGGAFASQFNQIREFYGLVESDAILRGEVVQIAMLDDAHSLYLARHEGRAHRVGTPLGSRIPAYRAATGLAMLSRLPDDYIADVLEREQVDADERELVTDKIAHVRRHGYAIDPGLGFEGIWGVAVPLSPWRPSDPPLALGVALPHAEASPEHLADLGAAALRVAGALENPFYRPPSTQ